MDEQEQRISLLPNEVDYEKFCKDSTCHNGGNRFKVWGNYKSIVLSASFQNDVFKTMNSFRFNEQLILEFLKSPENFPVPVPFNNSLETQQTTDNFERQVSNGCFSIPFFRQIGEFNL